MFLYSYKIYCYFVFHLKPIPKTCSNMICFVIFISICFYVMLSILRRVVVSNCVTYIYFLLYSWINAFSWKFTQQYCVPAIITEIYLRAKVHMIRIWTKLGPNVSYQSTVVLSCFYYIFCYFTYQFRYYTVTFLQITVALYLVV